MPTKGITQCLPSLLPFLHLSVVFPPSTGTLLLNLVKLLEILATFVVRQQFLHNCLLLIVLLNLHTEEFCGRLHDRTHLQCL